jgi:hypothetical protein
VRAKDAGWLVLLTVGGFLVQGYHPYTDDASFYVPAIKKVLDPSLYPRGAEFFESHARLTLFPNLVAWMVRLLHLPLDPVLLLLHLASLFLFLLACWKVSCLCFESPEARWCAVATVAATLTVPVTGTALFLFDSFLNPRSIAAFAAIFAVAAALERRYALAVVWLLGAGLVHPLMPVYGIFFVVLLAWNRRTESGMTATAPSTAVVTAIAPLGISLDPPTPAYHQAALRHDFHYVLKWEWYQWIGIFAPVAVFLWFSRVARERRMENVALLCRTLVPFVLISLGAALVLGIPAQFEALARFQPMRSLHLAYVLMFVLVGGMLGQFILKRSAARWLLLFLPLCGGLYAVQAAELPATAHYELPGRASHNQWVQAFEWVRQNTPRDAYFALDPLHMALQGEDVHGFRAIAERSMLADAVKDSGAVSMFPGLADEWWEQVTAQDRWRAFQAADFARLKSRYGVDWVIVEQPGVPGLACPYENAAVRVCRVD